MKAKDMLLVVPLLLALRFPSAWPELGWLMIMLLVLRCLDVPRVAAGADGANATSEATLGEASPVRLQALIFQVVFMMSIGISKFFVNYSPWLCEACCAALMVHTIYMFFTMQTASVKDDVPAPVAVEAPGAKETSKAASRRSSETAIAAKAEKVSEPSAKPKRSGLDGSLWADLEEEDEFQEVLAAKLQQSEGAAPSASSKPEKPAPAKEEVQMQPEADAGDADAQRTKKKAKAKKVREGAARKDEAPNPWAARIRSCGKAKDLEGALQVVEEALSSGVSSRQHQEIQNALLHALIQCGDAAGETATELFNQLKAEKKADVVTFNIMLRSLLCAGKRDEAQFLLRDMREHGLSANKVTIAELLSDRTRANDAEGVWRIVDWMQSTEFGITNAACSILLKRITAESPAEEVDRTFALIEQLSEPLDEALCSQAVEAAVRTQKTQLASRFMDTLGTLRSKKTSGSAATFGSMIKLHGQNTDLQQVWSTWKLMHEKGISPSSVTLGCMVEALVNCSSVEEAAKLVRETASNGDSSILNTVIYSSIIKGFAQAKQAEKCFRTLEEMEAQGIPGNTITYNTLLDACAKCGTMSRVPAIFEKMKQSDVEPDRITYSTLIKGYCVAGELDCAFKLFEELKADGKLDLDEIVYNSLLDGCSRKQKPQKAMEYLQDMISVGIQPSNYTLSIMVKLLGRAKRLNEALKLAEDYRQEFNLKLNVQVFTCLMQACLLNKKVQKALDIYKEMIGELGRLPDRKAHTVLVDGCLNAGAFEEAVQVCRCAYGFGSYDLFVALDEDVDGRLGLTELHQGLERLVKLSPGANRQEVELCELMESLDMGGTGFIGWVQWTAVALTAVPTLATEPEPLQTVFRMMDRPSCDGIISVVDLMVLLNDGTGHGSAAMTKLQEEAKTLVNKWSSQSQGLTLQDAKRLLQAAAQECWLPANAGSSPSSQSAKQPGWLGCCEQNQPEMRQETISTKPAIPRVRLEDMKLPPSTA